MEEENLPHLTAATRWRDGSGSGSGSDRPSRGGGKGGERWMLCLGCLAAVSWQQISAVEGWWIQGATTTSTTSTTTSTTSTGRAMRGVDSTSATHRQGSLGRRPSPGGGADTRGRGGGRGGLGLGVGLGATSGTPSSTYDGTALARRVFADPRFYGGDAAEAAYFRPKREKVFGENMTVDQVRQQYGDKLLELANLIRADFFAVRDYFDVVPLETRLSQLGILGLDGSDEVEIFKARRLKDGVGMPSAFRVFDSVVKGKTRKDRENKLCYVMGSSGSGKTFFALQHLRDFLNDKGLPSVTLYVSPNELLTENDFEPRQRAPEVLVDAVKRKLEVALRGLGAAAWPGPLKMHACVVFDEAASYSLRRLFEDKDMVASLLAGMKRANIAESMVVVVVGTGLTAQAFDSRKDGYIFRLQPWKRDDLVALLNQFIAKTDQDRLVLKRGETSTEVLADAVGALPLLEALATNGRAAYYLVRTLAAAARRTAGFTNQSWRSHLSFLVPTIVDEVVNEYMKNNGISRLSDEARPRVAAWVFGALSRLKKGSLELPTFEGLIDEDDEPAIALMLIQFNVLKADGRPFLVQGELYAASVTPALAVVLFNMVGVFTGVLSGWRGEEGVAALYAAHQAIIERFNGHVRDICELKKDTSYDKQLKGLIKKFDESLKEVRVYRLQHPIQSNPGGSSITIPLVPRNSIMINADRASFADIIAPYMLLQTKHTSKAQAQVSVNLAVEVGKCCLLKISKADRALRWLVALWAGEFDDLVAIGEAATNEQELASGRTQREQEFQKLQTSNAYPANLIMTRQAYDGGVYDKISSGATLRNSKIDIPVLPARLDIAFVVSTNAEEVVIDLPEKISLVITAASLDDAMQVDLNKLNDEDRGPWLSFLESMRDGVKLQFLFTGGGVTDLTPPAPGGLP